MKMSESIYKNDELENEMSLDMSYFWYSDVQSPNVLGEGGCHDVGSTSRCPASKQQATNAFCRIMQSWATPIPTATAV